MDDGVMTVFDCILSYLFFKIKAAISDLIGPLCLSCVEPIPSHASLYYGFNSFAFELNEIEPEQIHLYAATDSRFRTDMRHLEEGNITEAESEAKRLEQLQLDHKRQREIDGITKTGAGQ